MPTWEEEEETRRSIELLEAIWASTSSGSTTDINSWGGTVTTLGQKVKAQSVPVTLASDQGTLDVNVVSGTISVGAVTVNNGAGAAAVNIQDGGNSITVDGIVAISNTTVPTDDVQYSKRVDEASSTITYIGAATVGASDAAAVWRISRMDTSTDLVILYADGNANFDNIWDNRAALSYS